MIRGGGREQKIAVGLTTFGNPARVERFLQALHVTGNMNIAKQFALTVYEDFSDDRQREICRAICREYEVQHENPGFWLGMQGIVEHALVGLPEELDWFIYLTDDTLPTPGLLDWAITWLCQLPSYVHAVQIPYWNYEDLYRSRSRDEFDNDSLQSLMDVPWNPHWYGPALYLNVNGSGYCVRRKAWKEIGGISQETWCHDEYLSYNIWTKTDGVIVSVPGPPVIHQGGGSTPDQHRFGHAHGRWSKIEGWLDAVGKTKEVCTEEARQAMRVKHEKFGLPLR